jgi:thiamine-phosphate pyrophosphorylase
MPAEGDEMQSHASELPRIAANVLGRVRQCGHECVASDRRSGRKGRWLEATARRHRTVETSMGDRMKVDLRVYAIVDPEVSGGHDLAELARRLAAGGTTLVQLRDKLSDTRAMVERARSIKAALGPVPLLINDRVDVALAAGADGVHIGWDDMAPADARRLLGPDAIIGLTINSAQRADATALDLIDYAGIGGVYGTTSKVTKNTPIGTAGLARVIDALHRRKAGFQTCGIAGIDARNAAAVIEAGADGVSVISALSLAADPQSASRELRSVVDAALAQRR